MHRAHEVAVLRAQELAGSPFEAATRMRADVEPGAHLGATPMHDQSFVLAVDARIQRDDAAIGQGFEPGEHALAFGRVGVTV